MPKGSVIVLVGRPNVGKSTLFNRLARRRKAVVHNQPGVTRDEVRASVVRLGRCFELVDTGGIDDESLGDSLEGRVQLRTRALIEGAAAVAVILDGVAGLTPADRPMVDLVRRSGKPALFLVNKIDHPGQLSRIHEFARLGIEPVIAVSAAHGVGINEIWAWLAAHVEAPEAPPRAPRGFVDVASDDDEVDEGEAGATAEPDRPPSFVLLGRPNAGKSSLLNRICGRERALVDAIPGTTRDAIDIEISRPGGPMIAVDTAGMRRPSRVVDDLENLIVGSSITALGRADVAVLVIDAEGGIADQDLRIAQLVWRRGRGLVVALNKGDLLAGPLRAQAEATVDERLPECRPLRIVTTSARTGAGVEALLRAVEEVASARRRRVPTPEITRWVSDIVTRRPPPLTARKRPTRLLYATQTGTAPPEVAIFVSQSETLPRAWMRHFVSTLRVRAGWIGVPLRIVQRVRERKSRGEGRRAVDER